MKASELIKKIVTLAEQKFQVDKYHLNDTVTPCVYPCNAYLWGAYLLRPTQTELAKGKIDPLYQPQTQMNYECESHFYVEAPTMMGALWALFYALETTEMKKSIVPDYAYSECADDSDPFEDGWDWGSE